MLKKVFLHVKRGPMDTTLVCVFPWEKPILEEIHGSNCQPVSIEKLCELPPGVTVKPVKLKKSVGIDGKIMTPDKPLSQRQLYEKMLLVDEDENPLADIGNEWGRMMEVYGRHMEIPTTNVEKVYGSFRNFQSCVRTFAKGKTPEFLMGDGADDGAAEDDLPIAEMTDDQLREKLTQSGIKFAKNAKREELEDLLLATA